MLKKKLGILILALASLVSCGNTGSSSIGNSQIEVGKNYQYDIVIYGGTSAGVMAAIAAKKEGANVCLITPDNYVGGMTSTGVMHGDLPEEEALGGLTKVFYQDLYKYYADKSNWFIGDRNSYLSVCTGWTGSEGVNGCDHASGTWWQHEPHVAQNIYKRMLSENEVPVFYNCYLDLEDGVTYDESTQQIKKIKLIDNTTFTADIFIDATYEGDLMAQANVTYTTGREDNRTYGETYNGIRTGGTYKCNAYNVEGDPESGLLPFVEEKHPGNTGAADGRVQSYGYRFVTTDKPENMVPFTKPDNYRPEWFEWLGRAFEAGYESSYKYKYLLVDPLPNGKYDVNQVDVAYICSDYVYSSYEGRKEIEKFYRDYTMGMIWFLQHDERVPEKTRNYWLGMGLPKDEYQDNGHFPYGLYIREGRRMVSDYVMTQHDVLKESEGGGKYAPQSICAGMYNADSHVVTKYVNLKDNYIYNEGGYWSNTNRIYPIAYRSIVPKKGECSNLIVPCCVSASHAAIASIRVEPTYMAIGESAGVAAYLAFKNKTSVQDVSYPQLKNRLLELKQNLAEGFKDTFEEKDIVVPNTDFNDEAKVVIDVDSANFTSKGTLKRSGDGSYSYNGAIAYITNTVNSGGTFTLDQKTLSGEVVIEIGDLYHSDYDDEQYTVTVHFNDGTSEDIIFKPDPSLRCNFKKGNKNLKFFELGKFTNVKSVEITKTENTTKYVRLCCIGVTPLSQDEGGNEPIEGAINIPDKNLKKMLVKAVGSTNNEVTAEQLKTVTELTKLSADPNLQIRDLTGIEYCVNLRKLDLSYQKFQDVSPLKKLTKLEELNLSYDPITNISELKTLTSLQKLVVIGVEDTQTGYSFLSNLTNLTFLNASTCRIKDVSFITSLTKLKKCYLVFNEIQNPELIPYFAEY